MLWESDKCSADMISITFSTAFLAPPTGLGQCLTPWSHDPCDVLTCCSPTITIKSQSPDKEDMKSTSETDLKSRVKHARDALDSWVKEVVAWHFDPQTGCPFWLDYAKNLDWDPRHEIRGYDDLGRFGGFQDEWLRGGPVRKWVPKAYADRPVYVFETGGSTGVPKSRINIDDFRTDYEAFSE